MALYDDVVSIAKNYMGPAADKFMSRQLNTHLGVAPASMGKQHLDDLAKWVFTSGKTLMDTAKAQDFSDKIKKLKG